MTNDYDSLKCLADVSHLIQANFNVWLINQCDLIKIELLDYKISL